MGTDLGFKNIHILVTVIENLLLVKGSSPFLKLHLYFLHWKFDFEINPSVEIECHSNVDFSNLNVWKRTANKNKKLSYEHRIVWGAAHFIPWNLMYGLELAFQMYGPFSLFFFLFFEFN